MTSLPDSAAPVQPSQVAVAASKQAHDDIKKFAAAIGMVLRETVLGFEQTVARITDMTVIRPGGEDRELIVALQNFDRLQQEFHSLSDVLARLSEVSAEEVLLGEAGPREPGYDLLATISVADLKDRLKRQLRSLTINMPAPDAPDEAIF